MVDDNSTSKREIPPWQQRSQPQDQSKPESASLVTEPNVVHDSGGPDKTPTSKSIDSAAKSFSETEVRSFLADPGVKDAPEEKKRSFLDTKGVSRELIDRILQEQNVETLEGKTNQSFDVSEFTAKQASQTTRPSQNDSRDSPPVVTYPEFLVKPQKPPPLVTLNRLLSTAYVAGGLAAVFYGASKYIIEPMTANLTESRHDFAQHSEDRLKDLNTRLEKVVSKVPAAKPNNVGTEVAASDIESITSDPTELFHRDIGVQTSPSLSRRSSTDSSISLMVSNKTLTERHEERIRMMRSHLDDILDSEVTSRESNGSLETSVAELREYLNGLVYMPPHSVEYGVWQPNGTTTKEKDDAVASFRNEIRGVKGMLLSARRFPAGKASARVGA